jgi:hypothetical protein
MLQQVITRQEALKNNIRRYFTGKPCKREHIAERNTSSGTCSECITLANKIFSSLYPEKKKEKNLAYRLKKKREYAENPEKFRKARSESFYRTKGFPVATRPRPELCECCQKPSTSKALALDHCHKTGVFRGWLCLKCNLGIGSLGDNFSGMLKAIRYLQPFSVMNVEV